MIRRVVGDSMLPTLKSGVILVFIRRRHYAIGDVVIFRHDSKEMVKRIVAISGSNCFDVRGDNSNYSTDSRQFGAIEGRAIIGAVIWPRLRLAQ